MFRNESLCIKKHTTIGDFFKYLESIVFVYEYLNEGDIKNVNMWDDVIRR